MSEAQSQAQSVEQAGTPGKTTGVGLEVGVLRSSQETPVTGVERRRDTCLGVRRGRDRWPRKGIRLYGAKPPTLAKSTAGNCGGVTGLGKPDTVNPSVRFDEGSESDGHWPMAFQSVGSGLLYYGISRKPEKQNLFENGEVGVMRRAKAGC